MENIDKRRYIKDKAGGDILLPLKYRNDNNQRLMVLKKCKDDDGNEEEKEVELSPILVYPIEVFDNIDDKTEKVKIKINRYDREKEIIVPKKVLFSKTEILQLANFGVPVTSNNAKDFVTYFEAFDRECFVKGKVPITTAVIKLGWRDNHTKFIPFNNDFLVDVDENMQRVLEAYHTSGTLEEWCNDMRDLRKNILFRFFLSTSFTGCLLDIIGHRNFSIYNFGKSRSR